MLITYEIIFYFENNIIVIIIKIIRCSAAVLSRKNIEINVSPNLENTLKSFFISHLLFKITTLSLIYRLPKQSFNRNRNQLKLSRVRSLISQVQAYTEVKNYPHFCTCCKINF